MSLYNAIHGYDISCFIFLPMLGYHPDKYPRFRDCFIEVEDHKQYKDHIFVLTRSNYDHDEENKLMSEHKNFMTNEKYYFNYDGTNREDDTFNYWVFGIPEQWKKDYYLLKERKIKEVSDEYVKQVIKVYPKIEKKINILFKR